MKIKKPNAQVPNMTNYSNVGSSTRIPRSSIDTTTMSSPSSKGNKKIFVLCLLLIAFLGFGGYYYYSWNSTGTEKSKAPKVKKDPKVAVQQDLDPSINEGPKTFPSPINGMMYSEKRGELFKNRRPMAVMIDNAISGARPQLGIGYADLVYEAIAEGGITRFMAIYQSTNAEKLMPLRSAREYYIQWLSEYDAIYLHHGGANSDSPETDALGNIIKYGIADYDCIHGESNCERDAEREAPHNSFADTARVWQWAEESGNMTNGKKFDSWTFKDDAPSQAPHRKVSYGFEKLNGGDYSVGWQYDPKTNSYLRFMGAYGTEPHYDGLTKTQLTAKTIIIQETSVRVADDGREVGHLIYGTSGEGPVTIVMDGQTVKGTWKKADRTARTQYFDASGNQISLNRGVIWISMIETGLPITVQ